MSSGQSGWLLEYGAVEDTQGSEFLWPPQIADDPSVPSLIFGFDVGRKDDGCQDNACPKKRSRPESCAPPGSKACREKLRRDRLNERFLELCSIIDPGKPPKADKVAVLSDAARLLSRLRAEAQKLKKSNEALRDNIKSLKEEKSELRDVKTRLKAEKERMEQLLKGTGAQPQFISHPPATAAATISFAAPNKFIPYANYSPAGFWQWIPPVALDTSKDSVLWPPVA